MTTKKNKKRTKGPKPEDGKLIPAPEEGRKTNDLIPYFSLQEIQASFCVSDCSQEERALFAEKLRQISKSTWGDLNNASRNGQGFERITKFKISVPKHLSARNMISFKLASIYRIIGYREGQIFHIVWIDPKGKAYKH